jgi:hypothetical protein
MKSLTKSLAVCSAMLLPFAAAAQEATSETTDVVAENVEKASSLTANIKRLAFEYMEHSVTNKKDPNYPDTYNADEERSIGGVFDGNITYDASKLVWVNGLFMNYSKSKNTHNDVTTENEKDDEDKCMDASNNEECGGCTREIGKPEGRCKR